MRAVISGVMVLWACSLFASPAAGAASTVTGMQSGYWWEAETAGSPLPPPPQVPSGGLWVSSDPAGPQSISALRFSLAPGATAATLTLKVDQAQPASRVAVWACPASGPWVVPKGAGAWASRPGSDCARGRVAGRLDTAGNEMTFQLGSLGAGPAVDVVLTPAPPSGPAANVGSPTFSATFEPVVAGEVTLVPAPPTAAPPPAPAPTFAPVPAGPVSAPPATTATAPPSGNVPVAAPGPATVTGVAPSLSPIRPATASAPAPSLAQPPSQGRAIGGSIASAVPRALGLPVRSWRDRLLLSFMLVDILAYAIIDARKRGARRGRPFLSLYGPPPSHGLRAAVSTAAARTGRPPPLR